MSRSANCTPNVCCRPMVTFDESWTAFWLCALWRHPPGKIPRFPAAPSQRPFRFVPDPILGLGGCRQAGWLLLCRDSAPAQAHLCLRDGRPRYQSSWSHAVAWAQRHPHDLAVCAGHPAGLITPVPRCPPACTSAASRTRTRCSQLRHERRPIRYPSSDRSHPLPARNVPARFPDQKTRRRLQRLDQRLLEIALQLDHIVTA